MSDQTPKRIAPEEWERYEFARHNWENGPRESYVDALIAAANEVEDAADALIAKLVAAMEERDAMLAAEYGSPTPKTAGYMRWWDDLRARADRARGTCRLHTDGSTEDCAPGHDCAECERGEER